MRASFLLPVCALSLRMLAAQSPSFDGASPESMNDLKRTLFFRDVGSGQPANREATYAARNAAYQKMVFYGKARRFVKLWKKFSTELTERETFNAKLAKQVSEAFHDLEKSEGWPVRAGR